jgi:hypothetical protein
MALPRSAPWAVALAALALALPATANAGETPFLDEGLGTYFGIAHEHWGGPVPSCVENGVTTVPVHAMLYDDPNPLVAARAEQPGCTLWLDRGHWRTMGRVAACMVVAHEWGHLLGYGHSDDPSDLMAEFPRRPPPGCVALRGHPRGARAAKRRQRSCGARSACLRRVP